MVDLKDDLQATYNDLVALQDQADRVPLAMALNAIGLALTMRDALQKAQKIIERDFPNGQLAIDIRNAIATTVSMDVIDVKYPQSGEDSGN